MLVTIICQYVTEDSQIGFADLTRRRLSNVPPHNCRYYDTRAIAVLYVLIPSHPVLTTVYRAAARVSSRTD